MANAATSIFYTAKSVRRQPAFSPLDKSRRGFLFVFLGLILLASACAVFYIATHIQVVNLGYKISQELQKKEKTIEENKRLDLEIARLKSPTRIETEAKGKLGLALPKTPQVFYLSRWDEGELAQIAASGGKAPSKSQIPQNSSGLDTNPLAPIKPVPALAKKSHPENIQTAAKETAKPSDKIPTRHPAATDLSPAAPKAALPIAKKLRAGAPTANPLFAKEAPRESGTVNKKSGSGVLVAKIVEKEGPRAGAPNNKPAKEKIPAVMIDPMP